MTRPVTYTTVEVCRLAHATFRQVDYWCRIGLLQPIYVHAGAPSRQMPEAGSGSQRRFSTHEALKATALTRMLADGITFEVAKRLIRQDQWGELVIRPLPNVDSVSELSEIQRLRAENEELLALVRSLTRLAGGELIIAQPTGVAS